MAALYLGFATPVGTAADYYDTNFRMGMLVGWQLNLNLSLNLETTVDFLNSRKAQDEYMSMPSTTAWELSFSPLVHLPVGYADLDLVMGPKAGFFALPEFGWLVGGNVGLLVVMGRTALGGLFSYTAGRPSSYFSEWIQTVSLDGVFLF